MGTGTAIAVGHHLGRTGGTKAMPAGGKTHKFMSVVIILKIIFNPHAVGKDAYKANIFSSYKIF